MLTDLIHEIWQTLSRNKLRTALTGFAVAWGIFMLVVLVGISQGLVGGFTDQMLSTEPVIKIWPGFTQRSWRGFREGRPIELRNRDMQTVAEADTRHITSVATRQDNDTAVFSTNTLSAATGYMGITPHFLKQERAYKVTSGRFINDADMKERRRVVVMRDEKAALLFGSAEAAVGKRVNALGLSWTIVGIYNCRWDSRSIVPYATARALDGYNDKVPQMTVGITDIKTNDDAKRINADIATALSHAHTFDPEDEGAVWINNDVTNRVQAQQVMNILVIVTWLIGLLTLLSGVVGVSNIMFVSVKERTHELGIRRAIGARRGSILLQMICESVAITTLCGYVGIVMGAGMLVVMGPMLEQMDMFAKPKLDLELALQMTIVLIICGALAGLLPALKATKVKPVEALRDE